ncbi:MAG: glycosyltransferase [Planctomycetia bacterium]|nr:glycosyltransferase [Planctomycetia bacterium]
MHVTVIIVTYESAAVLGPCLESVRGLEDVSVRVVDNASTDASRDIARSLGADVMPLERNLGFAAAANRGAEGVSAGLLCFLNPDCCLTAEAVRVAREALGDGRGRCGVPDFEQGGEVVSGRQPGYTWRKVLADVMEGNRRLRFATRWLRRHPRHHHRDWHWPLGTCLFVPAEYFRAVGRFDERYFLYMEDVEFGIQVCRSGGEVIGLPVRLRHVGMQGSTISSERRQQMLDEARIQFARRHYGPLVATLATCATLGSRR